jgi:flagellar assembly protein FliH
MTSLFDFGDAVGSAIADMPVDLISAGGRGVSVLEFFVLEDAERERLAREDAESLTRQPQESAPAERANQIHAMVEAARSDALEQARRQFESELEQRLDQERARVEAVASEFAMDRQRYFAAAETQVVGLAIAIARRVLSREVEADVMHLTATVRAALARVHNGSATTLRVRSSEQPQWEALFANSREGSVTVVGDQRMEAGECVLETDVGRVELGVQVQLAEIERGFGDLLRRQGD